MSPVTASDLVDHLAAALDLRAKKNPGALATGVQTMLVAGAIAGKHGILAQNHRTHVIAR